MIHVVHLFTLPDTLRTAPPPPPTTSFPHNSYTQEEEEEEEVEAALYLAPHCVSPSLAPAASDPAMLVDSLVSLIRLTFTHSHPPPTHIQYHDLKLNRTTPLSMQLYDVVIIFFL